jgi:hypothetical protein
VKAKSQNPRDIATRRKPGAPSLTYSQWLAAAGAPVQASPSMRPRDWRNLYISGATPEQAAEYAERRRYNSEIAPALRAKRR